MSTVSESAPRTDLVVNSSLLCGVSALFIVLYGVAVRRATRLHVAGHMGLAVVVAPRANAKTPIALAGAKAPLKPSGHMGGVDSPGFKPMSSPTAVGAGSGRGGPAVLGLVVPPTSTFAPATTPTASAGAGGAGGSAPALTLTVGGGTDSARALCVGSAGITARTARSSSMDAPPSPAAAAADAMATPLTPGGGNPSPSAAAAAAAGHTVLLLPTTATAKTPTMKSGAAAIGAMGGRRGSNAVRAVHVRAGSGVPQPQQPQYHHFAATPIPPEPRNYSFWARWLGLLAAILYLGDSANINFVYAADRANAAVQDILRGWLQASLFSVYTLWTHYTSKALFVQLRRPYPLWLRRALWFPIAFFATFIVVLAIAGNYEAGENACRALYLFLFAFTVLWLAVFILVTYGVLRAELTRFAARAGGGGAPTTPHGAAAGSAGQQQPRASSAWQHQPIPSPKPSPAAADKPQGLSSEHNNKPERGTVAQHPAVAGAISNAVALDVSYVHRTLRQMEWLIGISGCVGALTAALYAVQGAGILRHDDPAGNDSSTKNTAVRVDGVAFTTFVLNWLPSVFLGIILWSAWPASGNGSGNNSEASTTSSTLSSPPPAPGGPQAPLQLQVAGVSSARMPVVGTAPPSPAAAAAVGISPVQVQPRASFVRR